MDVVYRIITVSIPHINLNKLNSMHGQLLPSYTFTKVIITGLKLMNYLTTIITYIFRSIKIKSSFMIRQMQPY